MTPQQIQSKLDLMRGHFFTYDEKTHKVVDFKIDIQLQKFQINTDRSTFKGQFESAPGFFKKWIDINNNHQNNNSMQNTESLPAELVKGNNLADELVVILKDNIDKVTKDPKYIPQASTISNSVNQIINIERLRLDMMKTMGGKQKTKN